MLQVRRGKGDNLGIIFHNTVFSKSFLLMQDSCQTDRNLSHDRISICRTVGILVVRILFSLLIFTGHLSDRLKFFAGQNANLLVLSGSPALFLKTDITSLKVKL